MRAELVFWALFALAGGCGSNSDDGTKNAADSGMGGAGGGGSLCPDPDDPRVHYESADPNECQGITLDCSTDQNGFQNQCGCGCIDKGDPLCPAPTDPEITWISHDPAECDPTPPSCPLGQNGFSNTCGCGCIAY